MATQLIYFCHTTFVQFFPSRRANHTEMDHSNEEIVSVLHRSAAAYNQHFLFDGIVRAVSVFTISVSFSPFSRMCRWSRKGLSQKIPVKSRTNFTDPSHDNARPSQ